MVTIQFQNFSVGQKSWTLVINQLKMFSSKHSVLSLQWVGSDISATLCSAVPLVLNCIVFCMAERKRAVCLVFVVVLLVCFLSKAFDKVEHS